MKPLISVVIPVYNTEQYLSRCLDSALAQTFHDFELICVNDGSTDNSKCILEEYAKKDKRIKIINQSNQGLSLARNNGLKDIRTPYVCFLDSDDSIDETFLMDLYQAALETDADVVMTGTRYIGNKIKNDPFRETVLTNFKDKIVILPHGGCWNKMYKTDFIAKYHLSFPEKLYWEDNIFTIKACYYSNKLVVLNRGKYNYYNNPNTITHDVSKSEKREKDSLKMLNLILDFIQEKQCSEEEKNAILRFCLRSFVTNSKQDCFKDVMKNSKFVVRMKLFGAIPCGKFVQKGNKRKGILKYLPFIKTKIKLLP